MSNEFSLRVTARYAGVIQRHGHAAIPLTQARYAHATPDTPFLTPPRPPSHSPRGFTQPVPVPQDPSGAPDGDGNSGCCFMDLFT